MIGAVIMNSVSSFMGSIERRLRRLIGLLPPDPKRPWDDAEVHPPGVPPEEIFSLVRTDPSAQYDVRHLIAALVDNPPATCPLEVQR